MAARIRCSSAPSRNRCRLYIALVAIRLAEILAELGDAIELVVGQIFRKPIAAIVGEIQFLGLWIPIEADAVADPERYDFGIAAVEIDAAQLAVILVMQHIVARLTDFHIELVVGTDRQEFPAVRFVLRQIAVDDGGLGRGVELVVDVFNLRNLRQFGDVERAVFGDAIGPIKARDQDMDLALAVLIRGDGIDLVLQARADKTVPLLLSASERALGMPLA